MLSQIIELEEQKISQKKDIDNQKKILKTMNLTDEELELQNALLESLRDQ